MDMDVEFNPDCDALNGRQPDVSAAASNQGTGQLGLAGTVSRDNVTEAAGLMTLTDDDFGGGPPTPMVPSGWR